MLPWPRRSESLEKQGPKHRNHCQSTDPFASGLCLKVLCFGVMLSSCSEPMNSPYPDERPDGNTLYSSFSERPKHLDPARAYSSNEYEIISQIYEPPLQYAYLERPYKLEPLAAATLPKVRYFDAKGGPLSPDADPKKVKFSVYELTIRDDLIFEPHPAFVRGALGEFKYHQLSSEVLSRIKTLQDFPERSSRRVTAEDFVYEVKRLVHPELHSPVGELMADYIVGLRALSERLQADQKTLREQGKKIQLRDYAISGIEVVDDVRLNIKIYGKHPQFKFWLAMPFFAPVAWEVDKFYDQKSLIESNISLDWYPVGTGPYRLIENDPNRRMVLDRNPAFHLDRYPFEGESDDRKHGYLSDAGRQLPFIDRMVLMLERETIPYWSKFLQGYYDVSGIASDNFDQAVQLSGVGNAELTESLKLKGIHLETTVAPSIHYIGFNMLDPLVGGFTKEKISLRQALSISVDIEEFIDIFMNGRGLPAQGVIPPGIFGHEEAEAGFNPVVYDWVDGSPKRKSLEIAKRLMREAGYPEGIDPSTGKPLLLYMDVAISGPDDRALLNWYRKQFGHLGVNLVLRATDYNQFQQKMAAGNAQIFRWGWNADYPDPENFLFLLYGRNGKVQFGGENAANYQNGEFDELFTRISALEDTDERRQLIARAQTILRHDAPWIFGVHPKRFSLSHEWYFNDKPNLMVNNNLKYLRLDPALRAEKRRQWNHPYLWPLVPVLLIAIYLWRWIGRAYSMKRGETVK